MSDALLDNVGVLLTRPEEQSRETAEAISAHGGSVTIFPALVIAPRDHADIAADAGELTPADITVFISRNAVQHGIDWAEGRIAAIGPTTAAAIEDTGRRVDIRPAAGFDSEALLAEPAFADVAGLTVRIIRGDAGRETLADTLRARGARVDYLSAYERRLPQPTPQALADLEAAWTGGRIDVVVVMSVQSLGNLQRILPPACRERLATTPLVSPAARVIKEARQAFPGCPAILAAGPQTGDLVNAIAEAGAARNEAGQD